MSIDHVVTEEPLSGEKTIVYFVDKEKQETADPILTVAQILEKAGLDPKTHYLVELRGEHQIKHVDPNEKLHIHEHEKFISVFSGPTPLS
jgi:hypothetical protein